MDNYTESKQRHVEYEHVNTCNYSNVTVIENKENPGVLFPLPNEPFFFSLSFLYNKNRRGPKQHWTQITLSDTFFTFSSVC